MLTNREGAMIYAVAAVVVVNSDGADTPDEDSRWPNRDQMFFDGHDSAVVRFRTQCEWPVTCGGGS